MADRLTLNMIETGLRAGLDAARAMVGSPAAALATAQQLLADDPDAVADFQGDARQVAGWLLNESRRGRRLDDAAMADPQDAPAAWLAAWDRSTALRDEFQGDREAFLAYCRHERRQGRGVPETQVTVQPTVDRVATQPAAAPSRHLPAPATPTAKLAAPMAKVDITSTRLSLAAASASLGLPPLDALPLTANVIAALRDCGLDPRTEGRDVTIDVRAVERIAADSTAANRLLLRLCGSVRSLGHVGGGGEVAFRR